MKQRTSLTAILSLMLLIMHSAKTSIGLVCLLSFIGAIVPAVLGLSVKAYYLIFGSLTLFLAVGLSANLGGFSHKPTYYHLWFSAPISALEKMISALSLSVLAFIGMTLSYTLSTAIVRAISLLTAGDLPPIISPFSATILAYGIVYLIIQPLYLFTAITVKSHPILTGTMIVFSTLAAIMMIFIGIFGNSALYSLLKTTVESLIQSDAQSPIDFLQKSVPSLIGIWGFTLLCIPTALWASIYYTCIEQESLAREL